MTSKIQTTTAAAAEQVAGNTDLLEEILVRLPPKLVTRFKLVSKQWLSQISDAQFVRRHCQHSHAHMKFHTGMFVTDTYRNCKFADFVSFTDELNPAHQTIPSLGFLYDGIESPIWKIEIINSCNGLVLCAVFWYSQPFEYCVCNPTTKTFRMLGIDTNPVRCSPKASACLAFDPSASLHYKVICRITTNSFDYDENLDLYSSKDQSWKTIACPYAYSPSSEGGFFLNGSIYYWIYGGRTPPLCFDVYNEVVKQIDLPSRTRPFWTFLGALGSHLYLLDRQYQTPDFRVCEMSYDFSQWVTKYNASVSPLLSAFPRISLLRRGRVLYCFKGITVVEGAKQDESQLVLGIPGKLLLYNLKDKTAKELYNLRGEMDGPHGYTNVKAFQFVETLSVV